MIQVIPTWKFTVTLDDGTEVTGTIADWHLSNAQRKLNEIAFDRARGIAISGDKSQRETMTEWNSNVTIPSSQAVYDTLTKKADLTPEQIAAIAGRQEQSWFYSSRAIPLSVAERDGLIARIRELEAALRAVTEKA
jgi:hypothetical protein